MKTSTKGYLYAILSGACFGIIPLLVLSISKNGVASNSFCVMMRMLLAGLMLLPLALRHGKQNPVPVKRVGEILVSAVLLSATSVLLYTSYQYIPSGIGITLHYMYPLVVMVLSVLLFHMRFNAKTVGAMGMSLVGIVLLCDASVLAENAVVGILLAVVSALTFASYLLWNDHRGLGAIDSFVFVTILSLLNAVFVFFYVWLTGQLYFHFSWSAVLILLCTGVFDIAAIMFQFLAIKYVGSVYTSILGTLEPIICTLGSALVLHEIISGRTLTGSALVLAAVIIVTLSSKK